eukprot:scaffold57086_cov59-Phaeocystis_antarctica.AAC.7
MSSSVMPPRCAKTSRSESIWVYSGVCAEHSAEHRVKLVPRVTARGAAAASSATSAVICDSATVGAGLLAGAAPSFVGSSWSTRGHSSSCRLAGRRFARSQSSRRLILYARP